MAAKLVHQVSPTYPPVATSAGISGTVVIRCIVGTDGSVRQPKYISGPPLLANSALDAVRKYQYQPTLLNGKPIEVDTTVSVVFTLGPNTAR
jgi:protein TonB